MRSAILRLSVMASESISVSMATRSEENDVFASGLQGVTKMPILDPAYRSGVAPRNVRRKFKRSSVRVRSSSFSIRCSMRWNIWRFVLKKSCHIYEDLFTAKDAKFTKMNLLCGICTAIHQRVRCLHKFSGGSWLTGICSRQDAKNAKSESLISLRPLRLCGRYSESSLWLGHARFFAVKFRFLRVWLT
jgi:hypothetical protein